MDIKAKIKVSGFHVHIINELNTGTSYADLQTDLQQKGSNLTINDLHNYHKTMVGYTGSKQEKPIQDMKGDNLGGSASVQHLINEANDFKEFSKGMKTLLSSGSSGDQCANSESVDTMFEILHQLFLRQSKIVYDLQTDYLVDDMVLMNNELNNLATIKNIYFDAVKMKPQQFKKV